MTNDNNDKKTQRGNLLFTPKVYKDSQTLAEIDGISLNEYLHRLAKREADKRKEEIDAKREILAIKNKIMNNIGTMTMEEQQELSNKMQELNKIIGKD